MRAGRDSEGRADPAGGAGVVDALAAAPGGRVRCVKCGLVNDEGLADCSGCGARLWVVCQACDAKNRRSDTACQRCGRRLRKAHRSNPRESRWSDGRMWVGLGIIVVLIAALAGLWVIFGRSHTPLAGWPALQGGLA